MLNNFYVLVDTESKQVIDKIQKLPENWKNISGLSRLSDEELCDLKWAGHHNLGWVNIHSERIKEYFSSQENFELNKNIFKLLITNIRKEEELEPIEYKGAKIKADLKSELSLFLLKENNQVNFKCINGYHTFNSQEISEILDSIQSRRQYLFNREKEIYENIDKCISIENFVDIKYDF